MRIPDHARLNDPGIEIREWKCPPRLAGELAAAQSLRLLGSHRAEHRRGAPGRYLPAFGLLNVFLKHLALRFVGLIAKLLPALLLGGKFLGRPLLLLVEFLHPLGVVNLLDDFDERAGLLFVLIEGILDLLVPLACQRAKVVVGVFADAGQFAPRRLERRFEPSSGRGLRAFQEILTRG